MKESDKIMVAQVGAEIERTLGEQFVARYPNMFTEDTEWWAQTLDEHFQDGKMKIEKMKELIMGLLTIHCNHSCEPGSEALKKEITQIFARY